jgi:hypothetical protein
MLYAQLAHVGIATSGDARRMGKLQLDAIGEEHRTFHNMNIAEYEYSGQGEQGSFARACNLHAGRA